MNPCKAKLPDGNPCSHQADEGQKYCPYHLADRVTMPKKIGLGALGVLGIVVGFIASGGGRVVKAVVKTVAENIKRI